MANKMKFALPAWLVLTIISVVAAVGLASTNMATRDIIAEQGLAEKKAAMSMLIPDANAFEAFKLEKGSAIDTLDIAKKDKDVVGYISQITKKGYGGPIQIIIAADKDFKLIGISVGGTDFAETAGLGTYVKEPKFTDQYKGKEAPLTLNKDIDQVAGATISSKAVNNGVNEAVELMKKLLAK